MTINVGKHEKYMAATLLHKQVNQGTSAYKHENIFTRTG